MELDDDYFDGGIFFEVVELRSGVLIPPWQDAIYKERACMLMQALSLKDGGEGVRHFSVR
ncbi:hypothetical protein RI820_000978 [Pluralibacter gergoviae]|nr:hypothetical protein [Pluralibacter gergoviae]ELC3016119.1 hypothetical protein [Pluralibacter gergoviae]ELC3021099.1 hypothetical protein [Pluralibacter gergoviae]